MLAKSLQKSRVRVRSAVRSGDLLAVTRSCNACYATVRALRYSPSPEPEELDLKENDFILSILHANPSLRDTKSYLASFGARPTPIRVPPALPALPPDMAISTELKEPAAQIAPSPVVASILNPVHRRTALVKLQGPFSDRQLESIARGMVYLEKLGLVSVIVVENDEWARGEEGERRAAAEDAMRVVWALERQGANARPVLEPIVRLGPKPEEDHEVYGRGNSFDLPEAHTCPSDLMPLRSALRAGEIPVLPPIALDSFCRSVRVHSNDVIGALARGLAEAAQLDHMRQAVDDDSPADGVDLTPMRLMVVNREGGVPSYARAGLPHLLINLTSEYTHIIDTFRDTWPTTHPTSLSNLSLARTCLAYMPPTSSAVFVSHRSPSSLIANLITNKPALSSSLPHAFLQNNRKLTPHTPTLVRRGLDIRVVRRVADIDKAKMTTLLERSFGRTLKQETFFNRLEKRLDFAIIAGDYAGAAIVTNEAELEDGRPLVYLDKFAVLPANQGDGTVDFLWVALHDETYGLGLSFSVNPNGGKEGRGEGRDLVWRSRADNPVNKWYFERSTGHMRMGKWVLFWCDAEKRLKAEALQHANASLSYVEDWEHDRLSQWGRIIPKIESSWA